MNTEFTQKMKGICEKTIKEIVGFFSADALEAHVFGSIAKGTNDALSDIDIWITFEDEKIAEVLANRMTSYSKFGQIILLHEMQNNFPLNGIQTAIIYKINDELVRVDFYLCPLSSSRVLPDSKILFEKQKIEVGNIIPETKRTPRDLSDRVTFFICMCFNGIKKVVRGDVTFAEFLTSEFKKYQKEIPELATVPKESSFIMIRKALTVLNTVSSPEQKAAIVEINSFLNKVELLSLFKSFNDDEFKIIEVKPCTKQYLFHSSGKKIEKLDPKYNRKLEAYGSVHEYGVPVLYASDAPSNAFCYEPTELYSKTREQYGTSVYHRLVYENHKILLGANLKGYIYVLKGSDFLEVTRDDFELGKWIRSTEWISPHEVTPIEVIEITQPYDWEMLPEYEFLGSEHVGEMAAQDYLKLAKDERVKKAIQDSIQEPFISFVPENLKKYL